MIARVFDGKPEGLSRDDVLDNITLYWLTNTAISSARLYWDTAHNLPPAGFFDVRGVKLPVGVSAFAEEIYQAPKSWAEKAYVKLIYYGNHPKGRHFAAWEQPALFVSDVRATFKSLRLNSSFGARLARAPDFISARREAISSMKTSTLLIAAVLAIAIGAPIAGFVGDSKVPQSTSPTGERVAFFHGLGGGPNGGQSELASLLRARRLAQFAAADARGPARQSRSRPFLDLHLHQLAAHAGLPSRLGGEIQGQGTGRDRRPHAGIPFEKNLDNVRREAKTCVSTTPSRSTAITPFGEPSITSIGRRSISSTRRGACVTSFRRGLLRPVGNGHSASAERPAPTASATT